METQQPDLKKVLMDALVETRTSKDKNEKSLKIDRKIAGINSIFFLFFFISMLFYPLVTSVFIAWVYIVTMLCAISLAVLRIKLYMRILKAEIEYSGYATIESLLEQDLEKIRTEEYARTRQTIAKGNSSEVPSTETAVTGSGKDAGSSKEQGESNSI